MKLPHLWSTQLSFGFTVNRRLVGCVSQLQNESRRLVKLRKIKVSAIDETLFQFKIIKSNLFFPVSVIGYLRYIDEYSTLVSGEIKEKTLSIFGMFASLVLFAILFKGISVMGWGILLFILPFLMCIPLFITYLLVEKREAKRFLREINQLLALEHLEPLHKKSPLKL